MSAHSPDIEHAGRERSGVLIIACGALAHEITYVLRVNGWQHASVRCLPPELHNRPERIPGEVRRLIHESRAQFAHTFVAYGDCGTGGSLDRMLEEEGVERIPGAHCYEFFAGKREFARLAEQEPGTFYLTDFLARHFDRLVWHGLGLDRHPQLQSVYFANYHRLIYLAQSEDDGLSERAREVAERLGLAFERVHTGFGDLERSLGNIPLSRITWRN